MSIKTDLHAPERLPNVSELPGNLTDRFFGWIRMDRFLKTGLKQVYVYENRSACTRTAPKCIRASWEIWRIGFHRHRPVLDLFSKTDPSDFSPDSSQNPIRHLHQLFSPFCSDLWGCRPVLIHLDVFWICFLKTSPNRSTRKNLILWSKQKSANLFGMWKYACCR